MSAQPTISEDVIRRAALQTDFDGWVSFSGDPLRRRCAASLHKQGVFARTRASGVFPRKSGWVYRLLQ